ncbi:histidine phosphatase family protein [Pseudopedobacter beijingensis]|uniref:Histidine phosphatase family protein n=1 Tax=Pseudopedobacter beijingensis TaxID=1207056 RepID=A0ABW4ICF8_9SPHI
MLNIYILRHGETLYNADGNRYCGRTDIGLTEKGYEQAKKVCSQVKDICFDAVYSSTLQRAKLTAQIASGKEEVITDERLIEVDFGLWEGKTREQFVAENAGVWESWDEDPFVSRAGETGETGKEVVERVDDFFKELLNKYPAGSNIMVVAHNGVNRLYLAYKLGMSLRNYRKIAMQNSVLSLVTLEGAGELVLHKLNCSG